MGNLPDINKIKKVFELPSQITDVTESISKGATSVQKITGKMSGPLKGIGQKISEISGSVVNTSEKVGTALNTWSTAGTKISGAITDLQYCQEVLSTSSLVVDSVVDSVTGHFHPRANETAFNAFDTQWDSWANVVNTAYYKLSSSNQENILESLAKEHFGENIFRLGSAIKNESANIFGGIADFEDALHTLRGDYRNPLVAAQKIERGVKGIVNATEQVTKSINNMIKTIGTKGADGNIVNGEGNQILTYIQNLHNTKALSSAMKVLSVGGGFATVSSDISSLQTAVKNKDIAAIYQSGKQTISDLNKFRKSLKSSTSTTIISPSVSSTTETSTTTAEDAVDNKDKEDDNDNDTDSYVCSGATMRCTFGEKTAKLTVYQDRTVFLTGNPMGNITDHITEYNIASFGKCRTTRFPPTGSATSANHGHLTPMRCVPGTDSNWMNGKEDYLIKGEPALLKSSTCKCKWGGKISIVNDGQVDK
jgi:hypothetical protein